MSEEAHSTRTYQVVFGVLLVALAISLVLAHFWGGPLMITAIFVIAGVKALFVANYFMHLGDEPHWLKLVVLSMLVALLILFIGFYIDIVTPFGGMEGS